MKNKRKVSVEYIKDLLKSINEFNSLDLHDIQLVENGIPLVISDDILNEWRFIGLTNTSFIELEFWKS
jgi:hypothetical protein